VKGPDGAYYISELTGVPFADGAARIYRLVPGEEPTIFLTGFKTVIDLDFGPDGSLYVLEHAGGPVFFGLPGRVIRVAPDGTRTPVVVGLTRPTSVVVDQDETIYVSNRGTSVGTGEVWRILQ
jgi:glucose/arabinose dehydrogenase